MAQDRKTASVVLESARSAHHFHVMERLQTFYQDKSMCDVTLTAGSYSVQAHRVVLAASSDYFSAMFSGNWSERKDSNITLHELTPCGLKAVVEFSYHGKLTVDTENTGDILLAIHHCQLEKAYKLFEDYIGENIDESNFAELIKFLKTFDLKNLWETLVKFAGIKFMAKYLDAEVSPLDGLETNFMKDVLAKWKYWKQGFGPIAVFDLVLKWAKKNKKENDLPKLLAPVSRCDIDVEAVKEYCQLSAKKRSETLSLGMNLCSWRFVSRRPEDVVVYRDDTNSWFPLPKLPVDVPLVRSCGFDVIDNVLYVCGGEGPVRHSVHSKLVVSGRSTNLCLKYDPCFDRWVQIQPMQMAREWFPTVHLDKKIFALGGSNEDHLPTDKVEIYDTVTNTWSDGVSLPFPLYKHAAVVHDGLIYISGGRLARITVELGELHCYDPVKKSWTEVDDNMIVGRFNHTVVAHDHHLYHVGGECYYEQEDIIEYIRGDDLVEYYDLITNDWTLVEIFTGPETDVLPFGACSFDNLLYLFYYGEQIASSARLHEYPAGFLYIAAYNPVDGTLQKLFEVKNEFVDAGDRLLPLKFTPLALKHATRLFQDLDGSDSSESDS
jgi:hypothetical protein